MGSKSKRRNKSKPKPIWMGMSPKFEAKLHPELARRVKYVMQDLFDRGWDPFIPEVYGREGTGYRSVADQQKILELTPGRTSVKFSFHNVTDDEGNPQSMAVHITDRNLGKNPTKTDPFIVDLEVICERHGLMSGNSWKKPWDPLHVQLYENKHKKLVQKGDRPPFMNAKLVLLPPRLSYHRQTNYLPPRSIDNLLAGERFILQDNYPNNNLYRRFNNLRLMPGSATNLFPNLSFDNNFSNLNLPEF